MKPNTSPAELSKSIAFVKTQTDKRIQKLFNEKIKLASKIDPEYRKLIEKMQTLIMRGGKRVRPFLSVVGYEIGGGSDIDTCLDLVVSLELLHNFMLIHDDVMDNDLRRYGGVNINGLYQRQFAKRYDGDFARRMGDSMAILAGDVNHSLAFECINRANIKDKTRQALIDYLAMITFNEAGGQQLDVLGVTKNTWNIKQLEKVYIYKTALYSITYPLQFGMLIASNTEHAKLSEEYGKHVGIAFQLHDDLLGLFGSERQIGKPVGSDLQEGKRTLVFAYAKQLATPMQWKVLEKLMFKTKVTYQDVVKARTILSESGARSKAIVAAQKHIDSAIEIVNRSNIRSDLKQVLIDFAQFCVTRTK